MEALAGSELKCRAIPQLRAFAGRKLLHAIPNSLSPIIVLTSAKVQDEGVMLVQPLSILILPIVWLPRSIFIYPSVKESIKQ